MRERETEGNILKGQPIMKEVDYFLEELTFREMQLEEWKRKEKRQMEEELGVEVIL